SETEATMETDAAPAEATDNLGGGLPSGSELQHDMNQEPQQNTDNEVDPNADVNEDAIMNGQTSEDAIKEMNQQDTLQAEPDASPERAEGSEPMLQ
ncbi:MAG TPA: hypothetical protein VD996_15465, partial [Chitinophagaceae bacterium]|nr:hypothetical protein [Chitinophagaceae bacterium]